MVLDAVPPSAYALERKAAASTLNTRHHGESAHPTRRTRATRPVLESYKYPQPQRGTRRFLRAVEQIAARHEQQPVPSGKRRLRSIPRSIRSILIPKCRPENRIRSVGAAPPNTIASDLAQLRREERTEERTTTKPTSTGEIQSGLCRQVPKK